MRFWTLVLALFFNLNLFGSAGTPSSTETTQTTLSAKSSEAMGPLLEIGTGLTTAIVGAQPGVHVGFQAPIGTPGLYAGAVTGAYLYTTPQLGTFIPVLASLGARFDLSSNAFFLMAIAPGVGLVNYDNSSKPGGKDHSDLYFNFMLKPAFHLTVGQGNQVVFSPRVGTLNGNLMFSPVIGTAIEL